MKNIYALILLLFFSISLVNAGDALSSLKQRRSEIDKLLKDQKVVEGADGLLHKNKLAKQTLSSGEIELIHLENKDRQFVFTKIAENDSSVNSKEEAGKRFAAKYIKIYKRGVLRENPANGLIYDSWPPKIETVDTLLSNFFDDLDEEETRLKNSIKGN